MSIPEDIQKAEADLAAARKRIVKLRKQQEPEPVKDYTLADREGKPVTLADLFGDKDDLIVVHNMGKGCRYCTLWADGFMGTYKHFENRAAFVVVSFDKPDIMNKFADSRDWKFRMASNNGTAFAKDMGFESDDGKPGPGVSTFKKNADRSIVRIAHAWFGPGDMFCPAWHFFDMLADGPDSWEPQYSYD